MKQLVCNVQHMVLPNMSCWCCKHCFVCSCVQGTLCWGVPCALGCCRGCPVAGPGCRSMHGVHYAAEAAARASALSSRQYLDALSLLTALCVCSAELWAQGQLVEACM